MFCGIEIKGNEAIIALCSCDDSKLIFVEDKFKKIALDVSSQDNYHSFYETFSSFVKQHDVEKIHLKKPIDKGQQISGANAFRIEALLNLCAIPVVSIHAVTLAAYIKKNPMNIQGADKANQYQMGALAAAFYGFSKVG